MSVFICDICGKHVDSDFKECYEHPKGLICHECQWEVEDDAEAKECARANLAALDALLLKVIESESMADVKTIAFGLIADLKKAEKRKGGL